MEKEADYFKVLSDPIRLRLAVLLAVKGQLCVCVLADALRQPQYKISRHLGILRRQGLVEVRRKGTWMYYRLRTHVHALERCVQDCFKTCFLEKPTVRQDLQRLAQAQCAEKAFEKSTRKKKR